MFTRNSHLTGHPAFLFSKSGNPIWYQSKSTPFLKEPSVVLTHTIHRRFLTTTLELFCELNTILAVTGQARLYHTCLLGPGIALVPAYSAFLQILETTMCLIPLTVRFYNEQWQGGRNFCFDDSSLAISESVSASLWAKTRKSG